MSDFLTYLAQAHHCRVDAIALELSPKATAARLAVILIEDGALPASGEIHDLWGALGPPAFLGRAPPPLSGHVAVVDSSAQFQDEKEPPATFRVLAIVPAYNEEDIIALTIADLVGQGLDVYLIDNWSSDRTIERAEPLMGRGLVGIERFPPDGPTATYDLGLLLRRVEQVAHRHRWAHWVMLHDADERRRSPWPGLSLRQAIWRVDKAGFSCIDHITLNFWPIDDVFDPQICDVEQHFRHFEFSTHPGHFHQRRAWKQTDAPASLATSAGHDVQFPSRRVYPYKFLLKHYPVRSQAHGERKVRRERIMRWNPEERARGWHRQYDDDPPYFLRSPQELILFDENTFWNGYLIQRLSGAGIFTEVPSWATPPCW
jgi:glycosyltransferase involved in cell wall biosynthesis